MVYMDLQALTIMVKNGKEENFFLPKQTSRVKSNLNNFDHYFDFLSVETNINKSGLNLITLEDSEALKRHIPDT